MVVELEEWRTFLYPLGFLSAIAFGGRFIIQWLESERASKTVVPRSFWILSLIGNILLAIHSFIQVQYHICLVQVCNAIISWRNLNLMKQVDKQFSFKAVLSFLFLAATLTTGAFILQDLILQHSTTHWFRTPVAPWQTGKHVDVSFFWHLLGTIAYLLFSSRFWLQWMISERAQKSELPLSFWWLSLIGAVFSIAYFTHLGDLVNLIGPLVGLVPYIRNLILMQKAPNKI
jgi:lipid-A-disaccharide synthase-like uncharacterized protein